MNKLFIIIGLSVGSASADTLSDLIHRDGKIIIQSLVKEAERELMKPENIALILKIRQALQDFPLAESERLLQNVLSGLDQEALQKTIQTILEKGEVEKYLPIALQYLDSGQLAEAKRLLKLYQQAYPNDARVQGLLNHLPKEP